MPAEPASSSPLPDAEFVSRLRSATQRYLASVDAWEAAYAKFYRLSTRNQVSSDLEPAQREYSQARKQLLEYVPRAKRLCLKYELGDPWPSILLIDLGSTSPQIASGAAIGRGERNRVTECLARMEEHVWAPPPAAESLPESSRVAAAQPPRGILQRLFSYFF